MKYFYLMFDYNKYGNRVDSAEANIYDIYRYDVCTGKRVNRFDQRIVFEYTSFGDNYIMLDNLANVYTWLIISKKTKEIWDKFLRGDEIQYINIPLKDLRTGNISYDYYIANIVNVLDAQNMEHSRTLGEEFKKRWSFTHFAVDEGKVMNEHIFKLKNLDFEDFISEPIKKAMKKAKLTGFDFGNVRVVDENGKLV